MVCGGFSLPLSSTRFFIAKDKINYLNYCRRILDLLLAHGVILSNNVLWSGEVPNQPPPDDQIAVIQELNRTVANDPHATAVSVMIRDGILVVRETGWLFVREED